MFYRITNLKCPLDAFSRPLTSLAARALGVRENELLSARLFRKSVDARDKGDVHLVLTIDCETARPLARLPRNVAPAAGDDWAIPPVRKTAARPAHRPVVVGMGPAGLFAALRLCRAGVPPLVLERGRPVEARAQDVERFWRTGALDPDSNVQFGEGGAGTFSDGKLNSGIKDPRCREVLLTFRDMGAPEEILTQAKPHIGTDRLRTVVRSLREEILRLGGEIRFETCLTGVDLRGGALRGIRAGGEDIPCEALILAIGHSARDTFAMLHGAGVFMEQKPFSIGARIEHPQSLIDRAQYGRAAGHAALGAADYKLSCHLPDGRAAYTFCMCPGGQVVAAASEEGGVAVNGMSAFARDGENANSALLVSVGPGDYGGDDPLAGVRFQRKWERAAYRAGLGDADEAPNAYRAPAQLVGDLLRGRASTGGGRVRPSYRPGVCYTTLESCLPDYVVEDMRLALKDFDRKLKGFADEEAVLTGVETRSSSPVRITRGEGCAALGLRGIYPAGEGAGYAGGILSAAVDGLRCAEALIKQLEER